VTALAQEIVESGVLLLATDGQGELLAKSELIKEEREKYRQHVKPRGDCNA
jgi:hypothetical protein